MSVGSTQTFEAMNWAIAVSRPKRMFSVRRCTGGIPFFAVSAGLRESRNQRRL